MFLLDGFLISVQFPIPIKMTVFVDQATHSSDGQISKLLTQSHSTYLVNLFQHFTFKYFQRYSQISERALSNSVSQFITPLWTIWVPLVIEKEVNISSIFNSLPLQRYAFLVIFSGDREKQYYRSMYRLSISCHDSSLSLLNSNILLMR